MTHSEILGRYGFTQTPCGPWRRENERTNCEYHLITISKHGYIYSEKHGYYSDGSIHDSQESIRQYAQPDQSLEDFMLQEFGPMPQRKIEISEEELQALLIERVGWALRDAADYSGSPHPTVDTITHYTKGLEKLIK